MKNFKKLTFRYLSLTSLFATTLHAAQAPVQPDSAYQAMQEQIHDNVKKDRLYVRDNVAQPNNGFTWKRMSDQTTKTITVIAQNQNVQNQPTILWMTSIPSKNGKLTLEKQNNNNELMLVYYDTSTENNDTITLQSTNRKVIETLRNYKGDTLVPVISDDGEFIMLHGQHRDETFIKSFCYDNNNQKKYVAKNKEDIEINTNTNKKITSVKIINKDTQKLMFDNDCFILDKEKYQNAQKHKDNRKYNLLEKESLLLDNIYDMVFADPQQNPQSKNMISTFTQIGNTLILNSYETFSNDLSTIKENLNDPTQTKLINQEIVSLQSINDLKKVTNVHVEVNTNDLNKTITVSYDDTSNAKKEENLTISFQGAMSDNIYKIRKGAANEPHLVHSFKQTGTTLNFFSYQTQNTGNLQADLHNIQQMNWDGSASLANFEGLNQVTKVTPVTENIFWSDVNITYLKTDHNQQSSSLRIHHRSNQLSAALTVTFCLLLLKKGISSALSKDEENPHPSQKKKRKSRKTKSKNNDFFV